jgi:DNA-binding transcriptional ArsR family regulator
MNTSMSASSSSTAETDAGLVHKLRRGYSTLVKRSDAIRRYYGLVKEDGGDANTVLNDDKEEELESSGLVDLVHGEKRGTCSLCSRAIALYSV